MLKKQRSRSSAAGFTLMETMLAVGLMTSLSLIAFAMGSKVTDSMKIAQAFEVAKDVGSQIQNRFSMFPNFTALSASPPSSMVRGIPVNGRFIKTPWGDASLMAATVANTADTWAINFTKVPRSACSTFLAKMSVNYYASSVNGTFTSAYSGKAVDPGEAVDLCNASLNEVAFVAIPTGAGTGALAPTCWAAVAGSGLPAWVGPPGRVEPALGTPPAMVSACGSATVAAGTPSAPTMIATTY